MLSLLRVKVFFVLFEQQLAKHTVGYLETWSEPGQPARLMVSVKRWMVMAKTRPTIC
jgi:hypothetical protein